jgi:uncharacterized membrane protein HdeD (DUF308 family)
MNTTAGASLKSLSGWSTAWGIILIFFGLLAIALPLATSLGVVIVIGWLLVFSGVFQGIHAFQSKGAGNIVWKLLVALLYVVVGFYFLTHLALGVASLTFAIAIFFLIEGVMDLVAYFADRQASGSGWILFDGIITLILAALIWKQWPSSSAWVVGTLVGISMLFTGMTRLMISLAVRRLVTAHA